MRLYELLEREYQKRNSHDELSHDRPDPLMVARKFQDEKIALVCALFAYGSAKQIVSFLESIDFDRCTVPGGYRFQTSEDVKQLLITLQKAKSLQKVFFEAYTRKCDILDGLRELISYLRNLNSYSSYGYNFLLGNPPPFKTKGVGAYKRWMMYLRWMVRSDELDMGLWNGVKRSDLIIPLDTHTFKVGKRLGLIARNQPDLAAAIEMTEALKRFEPEDPLKYDFVLYRIGQENLSLD